MRHTSSASGGASMRERPLTPQPQRKSGSSSGSGNSELASYVGMASSSGSSSISANGHRQMRAVRPSVSSPASDSPMSGGRKYSAMFCTDEFGNT